MLSASTTFIPAGFNHCIADDFYLIADRVFTGAWLATLPGNILGATVPSMPVGKKDA